MKHVKPFFMRPFLKLSFAFFLSGASIENTIYAGMAAPAIHSDTLIHNDKGGPAIPSVHEMFKDVPQDELLQMMEEGQQFIKYLEEHGTPEEKMAFAQAMEETLQGFTEDDWNEFEQIVKTVEDKLPPLVLEPKEEEVPVAKPELPKKEEVKPAVIDNSLGKILHDINKAINALLLKAKSDKVLTERITIGWANKDNFNEMNRLLQTLNKKDHIAKLTTSKNEAIATLFESIQNFNKRLQAENDNFVIADTFGLQADEQTTAANLKKLNKILDFFNNAIESLLPKLVKFIEEYEPDALKIAKENEDSAKKALEHATKVEKQKRPLGSMNYQDRAPSNGSNGNRNNHPHRGGHYDGGQAPQQEITPGYLEEIHRANIKNTLPQKNSGSNGGTSAGAPGTKSDDKKDVQKKHTQYDIAIDNLETYLESNGNAEVKSYMGTVAKTGNIYASFGNPIHDEDTARFRALQQKRSDAHTSLNIEESRFLQKYEEQWQAAHASFDTNTQAAHTYYGNLSESIANIAPQIDEMSQVLNSVKSSLSDMHAAELEKLNNSSALKEFAQRINNYHATFKRVQNELRNKHKLHRLQGKDASETRSYDDLAHKVENLHGLDRRISDVKSQLESLHKAIKSTIARRKREEHKAERSH